MKRSALAVAMFAMCAMAAGQNYPSPAHQQTTTNPGSRFELVQSPLAAKWTFRLDRFTGRVWQLVKTNDDDNAWEEMRVIGAPKLQSATRARFQLFTSGLAARHTFFLDSDTGNTWTVVAGKGKNKDGSEFEYNFWQPFAE